MTNEDLARFYQSKTNPDSDNDSIRLSELKQLMSEPSSVAVDENGVEVSYSNCIKISLPIVSGRGIAIDKSEDGKSIVVNLVPSVGMFVFISTEHTTVAVTRNGSVVKNNQQVFKNDVLTITATADTGYKLDKLTVNGVDTDSGDTYTVDDEDVVIIATSVEE